MSQDPVLEFLAYTVSRLQPPKMILVFKVIRPIHPDCIISSIPVGEAPTVVTCSIVRTSPLTRSPWSRQLSHGSGVFKEMKPSSCKLGQCHSFRVSNRRRVQLILFLAILLISFMPTQYACVAGCSKTYEKSASLVHHKNRCPIALELRKKSQEIRVQKGENGFPKLLNISERTQRFVVCDRPFTGVQNC